MAKFSQIWVAFTGSKFSKRARKEDSTMYLTNIGFWITCCPAFMLTMLPSCYFCDTGRVKSMSLTEVVDAMHHVLYAVGVSEDKSLSTPLIPFIGAFLTLALSFLGRGFSLLPTCLRFLWLSSRISRSITFMLRTLPVGYIHERCATKSMSITKL